MVISELFLCNENVYFSVTFGLLSDIVDKTNAIEEPSDFLECEKSGSANKNSWPKEVGVAEIKTELFINFTYC